MTKNNARRSQRRWQRGPRGMTVIVVLGVISITLALSYAMLRSQVTSVEIQSNLERRNLARQAAYAGISAALRKMHSSSWGGVDSTLEQDLAREQWFEVSFATGDASLTPTSTDYSEYPFRVTICSVGYAADPAQPDVRATYKVQAIVELVRKKLQTAPTAWQAARTFTCFQWSASGSAYEVPVRVDGPMWLQGSITVGSDYPADSASRTQYYNDLTAMNSAGLGDFRPFSGPIYTPFSKQSSATRTFLQTGQQLTLVDVPVAIGAPVTLPSTGQFAYQLYPGGRTYNLPTLQSVYGSTLTGVTLAPDPVENPLGMYLSSGVLNLGSNTNITGTIVTTGSDPDVRIIGKNVVLNAYTLPALYDSTTPYQLPVAIVRDDFQVQSDSTSTIRGAVVAADEFSFERGHADMACNLEGRVLSSKLYLYGREVWDLPALVWNSDLLLFNAQKTLLNGIKYFPQWQKAGRNFDHIPKLTIKPGSSQIVHHWNTFGQPIYVAGDGDDGLRWNLIDWTDNPASF